MKNATLFSAKYLPEQFQSLFDSFQYSVFAGKNGGWIATSNVGNLEAIAEPIESGWNCRVVDTDANVETIWSGYVKA